MLETETYIKQFFEKKIELESNTKPKGVYGKNSCW